MLIPIAVLMVRLDWLAVALPGDIDPLPSADVLYVTSPATSRLNVQDKAVELGIVTTCARHSEVGKKFTAVEFKQIFYAIVTESEIERASVGTANGSGCENVPIEKLGQIIDLCFDGG